MGQMPSEIIDTKTSEKMMSTNKFAAHQMLMDRERDRGVCDDNMIVTRYSVHSFDTQSKEK